MASTISGFRSSPDNTIAPIGIDSNRSTRCHLDDSGGVMVFVQKICASRQLLIFFRTGASRIELRYRGIEDRNRDRTDMFRDE
jgi:hypothetical protein